MSSRPEQSPIPGITPFNATERLFALSGAIANQRDPSFCDALHAIESLDAADLMGFNHLPSHAGFVDSMNTLNGPRYQGAPVTDPALAKLHEAMLRILACSRYCRGPDDRPGRESFLIAPMVVFLGHERADEPSFDERNFGGSLTPSSRTLNSLNRRYGGRFSQVSPLMELGGSLPCRRSPDEIDELGVPSFNLARTISHMAMDRGDIDLHAILDDHLDESCDISPASFIGMGDGQGYAIGPRVHFAGLGLTHYSPVGQCHALFSPSNDGWDFVDVSPDLRVDLPLVVGEQCSVVLLKPRPIWDAIYAICSLQAFAGEIYTAAFSTKVSHSFTGLLACPSEVSGEWHMACRIVKDKTGGVDLPVFRGDKPMISLLETLFRRLCAACQIDIEESHPKRWDF